VQTYVRHYPEFVAVIVQPGDTFSSLAAKYLHDPSLDWFIAEFNDTETLRPGQELILPLMLREKGGLTLQGYQAVPVLSYHKFSQNKADAMTVTAKAFEEQMRFLKQKGYRVLTMDEFFAFLDFKAQIPKKSVVITIDDGWRSAYDIAFPILKKYGYPATLFVYTDLISPNDKTLDWSLIGAMAQGGIDIQCHTKTHRKLEKSSQESWREFFAAVKKELTESAQIIKRRINKDVKYLAYPYGDTNPFVVTLVRKLGYRGAFTVERESNPFFIHPYRIHRAMIYGHFDLQDFEKNLTYFSEKALR
jgi:peptidoglycan/xylan/chitin deacetylase (PgdA/CDA1 family)